MKKIAVVTGSSSGIGEAIARRLLHMGYKVYGVARGGQPIQEADFVPVQANLADPQSFEVIADSIREVHIDLLVNNAGVILEQAGLDFTNDAYQAIFDVNFKAPILLTQKLKEKIQGSLVITVSSVSDRWVGENHALYCSSKAAVSKYFEALAMSEKNIRFITLLPDYVDTPLLRKAHPGNDIKWEEIIKPAEIAQFVEKIVAGNYELASGAKIIIVSESLKEDLYYDEDLWGYNVTSKELTEL